MKGLISLTRPLIFRLSTVLSIVLLSSCSAGTWEDDEKNWKRAFNADPPPDMTIKHSWYWRSPHFSFEHQYFFEISYTDSLAKIFSQADDLVRVDSANYKDINFFGEKPKWFVPNSYSDYDIMTSKEFDHYFVFIDKHKKSIYFTDSQF